MFMPTLLKLACLLLSFGKSKSQQQLKKPYTLTVMHLVPISGDDAFNVGTSCILANEIAAKAVNSRSDILPDYNIEMRYIDEETGKGAPKQAISYVRSFEGPEGNKTLQSPIIIGPQYSTGCSAMGRMLHHINTVALSTYCMAPGLSKRESIPNMYLSQTTEKNIMEAYLRFIRETGRWKQFAILANIGSFRNYQSALFLLDQASNAGVAVPWIDMFMSVDAHGMELLKQADIRIIAVVTSNDFDTNQILCEAYNQGITGSRYTFLADIGAFVDPSFVPDELYPGCTRAKLIEQMKITIWFGDVLSPLPERSQQKSYLGHTYPEVDAILANLTDNRQPADWLARFLCYDAAVRTYAALDEAEKKLRKMNMSLRDYQTNPAQVAKIANESLHHVKVMGLRTPGLMSFNDYGNVDSDVQEVDVWLPGGKSLVTLATFQQIPNTTEYQYDSYYLRWVDSLDKYWRAPRDQAAHVNITSKVSKGVFVAVLVLAAVLACTQLAGIFYALTKRANTFYPFAKIQGTLGCLILNAAAIVFAAPDVDSPLSTAGVVLLVIGSSAVTSVLTARPGLITRKYVDKSERLSTFGSRSRNSRSNRASKLNISSSNSDVNRFPTAEKLAKKSSAVPIIVNWQALDAKTCALSLACCAVNGVLLVAWLVSDSIDCLVTTDSTYVAVEDTVFETWLLSCASSRAMSWSLALLFFQVAVMFAGMVFAYQLGHVTISCREVEFMRAGIFNATTVVLAMLMIVVVIRQSIGQRIAVAFGILFLSTTTSLSWYYPMIKYRGQI